MRIYDVTEDKRSKVPESTVERLKRMKGAVDRAYRLRNIPADQAAIDLKDIPF